MIPEIFWDHYSLLLLTVPISQFSSLSCCFQLFSLSLRLCTVRERDSVYIRRLVCNVLNLITKLWKYGYIRSLQQKTHNGVIITTEARLSGMGWGWRINHVTTSWCIILVGWLIFDGKERLLKVSWLIESSSKIAVVVCLCIRARWEYQFLNLISGCMYSYVKLNFKADLFSSTFWFERIFISKIRL